MSQIDGAYPRCNAAMVTSGQYDNQLVSLVGKFVAAGNTPEFECCDHGRVPLDLAHAGDVPQPQGVAVEIVGQATPGGQVVVRKKELIG